MPNKANNSTLTGLENPFDELLAGDFPIPVLVLPVEEVHGPGFVLPHPGDVLETPNVKVEVLESVLLFMELTTLVLIDNSYS